MHGCADTQAVTCGSPAGTYQYDPAAISGNVSVAYRREVVLCVNFVIECHKAVKPRPAGSNRTRCKPESAMNVLREVRRVFKKAMVPLMPLTSVTQACVHE
mgnify:CR=1 FL=1